MGILTDWYIHNLVILTRVTECVSAEEVAFMNYELDHLLDSAETSTIVLLHFDGVENNTNGLFSAEKLKTLQHPRVGCLICCGDIGRTLRAVCKSPRAFGPDFDCLMFEEWREVQNYLLEKCETVTPLDIENAEDLLDLKGWR
ncbi:MAG: hypothetical protein L0154_20205 [Chloroflexi bacterium]|nr:hypothetical protein [Chloroflexota bacterium]